MSNLWDKMLSLALLGCAVAISGAVVKREFFATAASAAPARPDEFIPEWRAVLPAGRVMGPPTAKVTLVVFNDFECPFCRRFHETATTIVERYQDDVALAFVHLPLPGHRFARPAARAAECAASFGRFKPMVDALFRGQDSLGLKSWSAFGVSAGIADTSTFAACMQSPDQLSQLEAGVAIAEKFNISSTPTVLLNGLKYGRTPTVDALTRAIDSLLASSDSRERGSTNH